MPGFGVGNGPYVIQVLDNAWKAFDAAQETATETRGTFEQAIADLAGQKLPDFTDPPEFFPPIRSSSDPMTWNAIPEVPEPDLAALEYAPPDAPDTGDWERGVDDALADIDRRLSELGDFVPSVTISPVPSPGAPTTPAQPTSPSITTPSVPSAPTIATPSLPLLSPTTIPGAPSLQLPTFSAIPPTFELEPPQPVGEFFDEPYVSAMLNAVNTKLTEMMQGKSGLPADVEQALFDRARAREDTLANKQTKEAILTWSSRGFSMPPGMLVAQVNAVQEDNHLKASALNRDVYIKAQETLIQQLNFAIGQVVTLEQALISLHNNVQQRRFEIIKLRVEQSIAIYNALVQAFNIRVQAYATEANIYKIRIDAEMAKIEIFKAEIEAQKLIGQVNQQQIELYRAQLEGLKTDVDLYRARIDAVRAVVEIGTQKVQTYRAQIDAYVALVQSERTKYDIFRAQVDAEIAKTNIISAEADVFKTKMSTIDAAASIAVKKVDGQLRLAQQQTAQFVAEAEAEKARITTAADMFRAQASAYENSLGVLRVEDERAVKAEEFNLTQFKTDWDNTLKQYEISIKKYDADMQRMIELAKLQQSNAQVIAQYASQIAAGAMSAVQMSISATGGATSSESWNVNQDI